jgi:hypothetical protein
LRFGDLIRGTHSLRAYQSDMMDRFVSVATQILAARAGVNPDEPEPHVAARALLGLWHVQASSLRKHLAGARTGAGPRTGDRRRPPRRPAPRNGAALVLGAGTARLASGPGPDTTGSTGYSSVCLSWSAKPPLKISSLMMNVKPSMNSRNSGVSAT